MGKYDDILNLPHHTSTQHPRMPRLDRAAQFAPFAALTGHSAAIEETARLTDELPEFTEEPMQELDEKLAKLREVLKDEPEITIVWFKNDERKSGGAWEVTDGKLRKIDDYARELVLADGTRIPMAQIREM